MKEWLTGPVVRQVAAALLLLAALAAGRDTVRVLCGPLLAVAPLALVVPEPSVSK